MKPKEFDELVRQKFDQNDFEYNPRNWDQLADELDGRAKKRSFIMWWWWVPLAGIAASVALAIGVMPMLRHEGADNTPSAIASAPHQSTVQPQAAHQEPLLAQVTTSPQGAMHYTKAHKQHTNTTVTTIDNNNIKTQKGLALQDVAASQPMNTFRPINLLNAGNVLPKDKTKEREKRVAMLEGVNTFKHTENEQQAQPKLSVILLGGINRGAQSNGYMAGATIRRMVNDKVFVEGDVAYANSSNSQANYTTIPGGGISAARHSAGKATMESGKVTTGDNARPDVVVADGNIAYNLSYVQATPSIGYKLMKKMSIAAGPDFQQVLADKRPALNGDYRGNQQEAALFDVGMIAKSEYTLTRNVKAAISYRKGINTVLTPSDKYFDRDYLQFQVRCAIFNK